MDYPENYVLSLGLFSRNYNFYQRDIHKVGMQTFYGKHNTGIVLDYGQWRAWSKCANVNFLILMFNFLITLFRCFVNTMTIIGIGV